MGIINLKKPLFLYSLIIVLSGAVFGTTFSTLCFIASGLSVTVLMCNRKNKQVLLSSLLGVLVCYLTSGTSTCISFILGGILPGVLLGIGYIKKLTLPYLAVIPSISFISLWAYLFYSYKITNGGNLFADVSKTVVNMTVTELETLFKSGTAPLPEEVLPELIRGVSSVMELANNLIPAFLIIFSALFSLILILLSKKLVGYMGRNVTTFSRFYVPGNLIFVSIICMAAFSLIESSAKYVFINVLLVLTSYCFLCGISILDFILKKKMSSSLSRVIILILILTVGNIILSGSVSMILITMGIMDSMFNYRKLPKAPRQG